MIKTKCQSWIKIFSLRRRWISLWSTLHIWWKEGKKQIVFFPPRQTYLFNQPTTFPLVHTFACLTFTLRVDCTTKVFKLNNFIPHTNRKHVNEMPYYFQQIQDSVWWILVQFFGNNVLFSFFKLSKHEMKENIVDLNFNAAAAWKKINFNNQSKNQIFKFIMVELQRPFKEKEPKRLHAMHIVWVLPFMLKYPLSDLADCMWEINHGLSRVLIKHHIIICQCIIIS